MIDLVHDGERVLVVQRRRLAVEVGRWARVDEVELDAGVEGHAVPDDVYQAAVANRGGDFGEDGLA